LIDLKNKLKDKYDSILLNIELKRKGRSLGEIDLLAQKGEEIDIYEVKCSYRIVKARKQLSRIKKYLNIGQVGTYFYCGSSGVITAV